MLQVEMSSEVRTVFGKGPMRQLRMQEITPGVVYASGLEPVPLQFATAQLFKDLLFHRWPQCVITLDIAGDSKGKRHVLVQEIQKILFPRICSMLILWKLIWKNKPSLPCP